MNKEDLIVIHKEGAMGYFKYCYVNKEKTLRYSFWMFDFEIRDAKIFENPVSFNMSDIVV